MPQFLGRPWSSLYSWTAAVTKRVRPKAREVGCIWWSLRGCPSHDLGQDIEVGEQRTIALAVEREESPDGYFHLAVETTSGFENVRLR